MLSKIFRIGKRVKIILAASAGAMQQLLGHRFQRSPRLAAGKVGDLPQGTLRIAFGELPRPGDASPFHDERGCPGQGPPGAGSAGECSGQPSVVILQPEDGREV